MALVSHKNKFIFILNPRTASTAMAQSLEKATQVEWVPPENTLNKNGMIVLRKKHTTVPELRAHDLVPDIDSYVKFTTVRNPFDSLVSAWNKKVGKYADLLDDPDAWVHQVKGYADGLRAAQETSFPEWIELKFGQKERARVNLSHIREVDHLIRFERLEQDLRELLPRIGIEPEDFELLSVNQTEKKQGRDFRDYYDAPTRATVERVFAEDLRTLNYSFEP